MYFTKSTIISFGLLATSQLVAGHSAITGATGDQGGQGSAIGVDPNTPRDGTRRNPFQQDATRFKGDAAATCGETLGGGDNDIEAGTAQVMQLNGGTLPQVSAGGQVSMTLHQVNGDGAGPYTCMIDATGTGTNWQPMQVTQNIDGNARGRNNDQQMQDLPLTAAVPADMACTGTVAGQSNVCMVRCENPARAGPFGGCVPVQMAGAAGAATGATPAAAGASPAAAAAAPPAGASPAAGAVSSPAAGAVAPPAAGASGTAATAGTGQQAAAGTATQGTGAQAGTAGTGTTGTQAGQAVAGAAGAGTQGTAAQGTAAQGTAAQGTAAQGTAAQGSAAQGQTLPAQGQNVGSTGAQAGAGTTGTQAGAGALPAQAQTAATKRSPKKASDGAIVTDDDQEEEVEFLDDEEATDFKRWVVKNF